MTEHEKKSSERSTNDDENEDNQLIKLCLKKPKKWNWELSTSKSSSHICFPTIQLYDEDKKLLVETNEADCTISSKQPKRSASASVSKASSLRTVKKIDSFKISINEESDLNNPIISEPEDVEELPYDNVVTTPDAIQVYSEHGILFHDSNSKEFKKPNQHEERSRKVYSRSNSMRSRSSVSILERISELKRDSSSDDETTSEKKLKGKSKTKYSYRTCNIGTIIVPKKSFSNVRRRQQQSSPPPSPTSTTEMAHKSDKLVAIKSKSSSNIRQHSHHSTKILDSQDFEDVNSQKLYDNINDYDEVNKSADEVFLLLVKRLASLQYNSQAPDNIKSLVEQTENFGEQQLLSKKSSRRSSLKAISNCFVEREKITNHLTKSVHDYDEVDFVSNQIHNTAEINEIHNVKQQSNTNKIMGSNVSSSKGLSGRRTQSSSNIDSQNKHSSITNGICCSTNSKYGTTKSGRKNSNLSQIEYDKRPLNNNNNNNRCNDIEHFDSIEQIITNQANTGTMKNKKTAHQSKSKDRKKLHGSLPNHLDTDATDVEGSDDTNSSVYQYPPNTNIQHKVSQDNPQMSVIRKFDEIYQQQHRYQLEPFAHQKQQNHSFRITNTYAKENFLRSQETNSFRIPQASGNRVKFQPINRIIMPSQPVKVIDQCYDQGYGSERSPEDELPPPLPIMDTGHYNAMLINATMTPGGMMENKLHLQAIDQQTRVHQTNAELYSFITEDSTFNVEIIKGSRGLGLSVSGGVDSTAPYPGLIRIKRLFPHQAAWATGKLQPGDILLEANGIILTGCTNNEALEVLRTMANVVNLLVCRPHDENYRKLSPLTSEPPKPPQRTSFNYKHLPQHHHFMQPLESILPPGEFEIILVKQQGSLGFTLQKEDESVLGHYVRALVREPATTDGRINAGDKIIAVNDVAITSMTHEQAVIFLRQSADTVKLRLYRDEGQTPISAMSPSDSDYKSYAGVNTLTKKKLLLRPEAMNLLNDLACKKNPQSSSDGNSASSSFQSSPNTNSSPRRLRKHNKCSVSSVVDSDTNNSSDSTLKSNNSCGFNQTYIISENTSSCGSGTMTPYSDSSADILTVINQSNAKAKYQNNSKYYDPHELVAIAPDDDDDDDDKEGFYDSDELEKLDDGSSPNDRPKRPEYLNLGGPSTPTVARKPFYQFSIATTNAYELNNLNNDILDAPTSYKMGMTLNQQSDDDCANNFTSLPCETLLLACKTEDDLKNSTPDNDMDTCLYVKAFNKQNPMYQSAQVQINHRINNHNNNNDGQMSQNNAMEKNLLKWKGVKMSADEDDDDKCSVISYRNNSIDDQNSLCSSNPQNLQRISIPNIQKDLDLDEMEINSNEYTIITVEMNRRWICRLGIRLESKEAPNNTAKSITVIKEICKDTVAERDGRLIPGDRVLMINDEIVDDRNTTEIINMMRITQGPLCITVARKKEE